MGQGSALGGSHGWGRQWTDLLSWPEPHSTPFRRLLAHRNIVPYLNTLLGRGWRRFVREAAEERGEPIRVDSALVQQLQR